eukprot:1186773-Prorocentrum_minimum.AAC.3
MAAAASWRPVDNPQESAGVHKTNLVEPNHCIHIHRHTVWSLSCSRLEPRLCNRLEPRLWPECCSRLAPALRNGL